MPSCSAKVVAIDLGHAQGALQVSLDAGYSSNAAVVGSQLGVLQASITLWPCSTPPDNAHCEIGRTLRQDGSMAWHGTVQLS